MWRTRSSWRLPRSRGPQYPPASIESLDGEIFRFARDVDRGFEAAARGPHSECSQAMWTRASEHPPGRDLRGAVPAGVRGQATVGAASDRQRRWIVRVADPGEAEGAVAHHPHRGESAVEDLPP